MMKLICGIVLVASSCQSAVCQLFTSTTLADFRMEPFPVSTGREMPNSWGDQTRRVNPRRPVMSRSDTRRPPRLSNRRHAQQPTVSLASRRRPRSASRPPTLSRADNRAARLLSVDTGLPSRGPRYLAEDAMRPVVVLRTRRIDALLQRETRSNRHGKPVTQPRDPRLSTFDILQRTGRDTLQPHQTHLHETNQRTSEKILGQDEENATGILPSRDRHVSVDEVEAEPASRPQVPLWYSSYHNYRPSINEAKKGSQAEYFDRNPPVEWGDSPYGYFQQLADELKISQPKRSSSTVSNEPQTASSRTAERATPIQGATQDNGTLVKSGAQTDATKQMRKNVGSNNLGESLSRKTDMEKTDACTGKAHNGCNDDKSASEVSAQEDDNNGGKNASPAVVLRSPETSAGVEPDHRSNHPAPQTSIRFPEALRGESTDESERNSEESQVEESYTEDKKDPEFPEPVPGPVDEAVDQTEETDVGESEGIDDGRGPGEKLTNKFDDDEPIPRGVSKQDWIRLGFLTPEERLWLYRRRPIPRLVVQGNNLTVEGNLEISPWAYRLY